MEKEHKIMMEEELEKAKLDLENELAEIQVRQSHDGGGVGGGEGGGVEVEMAKLDFENELLVRVCALVCVLSEVDVAIITLCVCICVCEIF